MTGLYKIGPGGTLQRVYMVRIGEGGALEWLPGESGPVRLGVTRARVLGFTPPVRLGITRARVLGFPWEDEPNPDPDPVRLGVVRARVLGVPAVPIDPEPDPEPEPRPKLTWEPPPLDDPLTWTPTEASRISPVFPNDRDVLVVLPSTPIDWKGGIETIGGRNVVCIGGEFKIDTPWWEAQYNGGVEGDAGITNRAWKFVGNYQSPSPAPRTVHIEGVKFHGSELYEVINWDGKGEAATTFVRQNIWVGPVRWKRPPGSTTGHHGGDYYQPISGPHTDRADREQLTHLSYQGYFLQAGSGYAPPRVWDYRHLQFTGVGGHAQLLAMNGDQPPPSDRLLSEVWVQNSGSRSPAQSVKGEWLSLSIGTAPEAFVDPAAVGIGYVSPGYLPQPEPDPVRLGVTRARVMAVAV